VVMVLLMILVATEPPVTLFVMGVLYVLSGPVSSAYKRLLRDKKGTEEQEEII